MGKIGSVAALEHAAVIRPGTPVDGLVHNHRGIAIPLQPRRQLPKGASLGDDKEVSALEDEEVHDGSLRVIRRLLELESVLVRRRMPNGILLHHPQTASKSLLEEADNTLVVRREEDVHVGVGQLAIAHVGSNRISKLRKIAHLQEFLVTVEQRLPTKSDLHSDEHPLTQRANVLVDKRTQRLLRPHRVLEEQVHHVGQEGRRLAPQVEIRQSGAVRVIVQEMGRDIRETVDEKSSLLGQLVEMIPLQCPTLRQKRVHEEELDVLALEGIVVVEQGERIIEIVVEHVKGSHYDEITLPKLLCTPLPVESAAIIQETSPMKTFANPDSPFGW